MNKLLFICHYFPPSSNIGSVRSWMIAKHLSRTGWDVTVLTPKPLNGFNAQDILRFEKQLRKESIELIYAGSINQIPPMPFRELATKGTRDMPRHKWILELINRLIFKLLLLVGITKEDLWALPAMTTSLKKNDQYDLVLVTGAPFGSFVAAKKLATKLKIPYVLDYRDPWALNSSRKFGALHKIIEKRILRGAAKVISVSKSQAILQQRGFILANTPTVITNGFDPESFESITAKTNKKFSIVYAGSFYKGKREIDPFFSALSQIKKTNPSISSQLSFHYYGDESKYIQQKALHYDIKEFVESYSRVPRQEVLAAIKGCDLALVIINSNEKMNLEERGILTGKLFEPLGMGIPVLLISPHGSDASEIVKKSTTGKTFSPSETQSLANWIVKIMKEGKPPKYQPPESYSWPYLANSLDKELRSLKPH